MDEGRLAAVRKRANLNRKNVILINDMIKNRQEVYANFLNKEQHGAASKSIAEEMGLKRTIVRNSILMQCLESRREKMVRKNPDLPLGKYGGRPIHTFSRDIESMISWMHPRLRRLRKVERMKENGLRLGAIIDPSTVPAKIDAVFGPAGERSNSDFTALAGANRSSRKSKDKTRRLSKSGGHVDPFSQRPLITRRIEAPSRKAFQNEATDKDEDAREDDRCKPSDTSGNEDSEARPSSESAAATALLQEHNRHTYTKAAPKIDHSTNCGQLPVTVNQDQRGACVYSSSSGSDRRSGGGVGQLKTNKDSSTRTPAGDSVGGDWTPGRNDAKRDDGSGVIDKLNEAKRDDGSGVIDKRNEAKRDDGSGVIDKLPPSRTKGKEATIDRRPSILVLPPIKTTRELVKK